MAVQTLSRLNRTYPGKASEDVFVLDFVNDPPKIMEAFEPYYRGATMLESTNLNLVHELANKLAAAMLYSLEVLDRAGEASLTGDHSALAGVVNPVAHDWKTKWENALLEDDRKELESLYEWRTDLSKYVRVYRFLSQLIDYQDTSLEKRAILYDALARTLQAPPSTISVDLSGLEMTHHRIKDEGPTALDLEKGQPTPLTPMLAVGASDLRDPKYSVWQPILEAINQLFGGTDLDDTDIIAVVDQTLRNVRKEGQQVQLAKANTDADFYGSSDVLGAFLEAALGLSQAQQKVVSALFANEDNTSLAKLLESIGYRQYLAGESTEDWQVVR